jgi:hypothetical protein
MGSPRFSISKDELYQWAHNTLVFAAPLLVVMIPVLVKDVPVDWKYGALTLYVLNITLDFARKFVPSTQ